MLSRTISTACLLLCLSWIAPACDDKAPETKGDPKAKVDPKAEDKKAETKVEEKKEEAKVEEKKEETKVEEAKVEEAKVEEAKVEEKKEETKVEEKKAEEKKADPKKPDPKKPDEPKPDPGPSADGKGLYDKKCKTCHNANGDGKTKIGAENDIEDWTVAGWKGKWTQQKIEDIVTNGKSGTKMKPFKDKLTADEIVAVAKFARSLGK